MVSDKKGASTAFSWFYSIVSLFGIMILFIIFQMVFQSHLVPLIKTQVNATANLDVATMATVNNSIDKYMFFFDLLPVILFFVVVLFMIVSAIRKEPDSGYQ